MTSKYSHLPIIWVVIITVLLIIVSIFSIIIQTKIYDNAATGQISSARFRAATESLSFAFFISVLLSMIALGAAVTLFYTKISLRVASTLAAIIIFACLMLLGIIYFAYDSYTQFGANGNPSVLTAGIGTLFGISIAFVAISIVMAIVFAGTIGLNEKRE